MPRVNKYATNRDLAKVVRKKLRVKENIARKVIDRYFSHIKSSILNNEHVHLKFFGSFELTKWKSGAYYSINEKRKVEKELKTVSFKPSAEFKKRVSD